MDLPKDLIAAVDKYKPNIQIKEILIPVPWGYVAAKWWGRQDCRPILLIHGWQDNAGSFDTLIPLLPKHIGYLAIDLPGHGLSSYLPAGMRYSKLEFMHTIHLIVTYFQWDKVSLISHSFGAISSFLYAGIFPERCDMLIAIDGIKPIIAKPKIIVSWLGKIIDESTKVDRLILKGSDPPSYEYNELIEKITGNNGNFPVTKETAPFLLVRGIKPSTQTNRWYFSRDPRLKYFNYSVVSHEVAVELARAIVAPILYIRGTQGVFWLDDCNQEVLTVLRKQDTFKFLQTDIRYHHLHLTDPECIKESIREYILKYRPIQGTINARL